MLARPGSIIALISALVGCSATEPLLGEVSRPEIGVEVYQTVVTGLPDPQMTALAEQSLAVYRLSDEGAQSRAFLRRRAEGDVPVIDRLLRAEGYYEGATTVTVSPEGEVPVTVTLAVVPGPRYTLASQTFSLLDAGGTPPRLDAAALGAPVRGPATAADILAAEDAAVGTLQRAGYAYARFLGRDAEADPEAKTITVVSTLQAGRPYSFGPVAFRGVTAVEERYLRTYLTFREGDRFDAVRLRDYQRELAETELFTAVTVAPPEDPPPGTVAPIVVTVDERVPRTVSAGLRYDTVDGPEGYGALTHRNLFGRNEEGTVALRAGIERQSLEAGLRFPQVWRNGQDLRTTLELRREDSEAFRELGGTATLGLEREIGETLILGAGGLVEVSRIEDGDEEGDALLAGLPVFAAVDTTDDPLDPRRGWRLRLDATPLGGQFDGETVGFLSLDGRASTYVALDQDGRYVFATRARIASIAAGALGDVPATRRLYAGGGGSVRGYALDFIGPIDDDGDPVGGLSAIELGAEMRARLYGDFGGVAFVDAGSVSTEPYPDLGEDVQIAAGLGLRYYSPVGPIRLDVAVPLNRRDVDDPIAAYFSIGQAF